MLQRPGPALASTVALFAVCALGLLAYKEDYSIDGFFKKAVESVEGFKVLERAFPAGRAGADHGARQREDGRVSDRRRRRGAPALHGVDGVARCAAGLKSNDGRARRST